MITKTTKTLIDSLNSLANIKETMGGELEDLNFQRNTINSKLQISEEEEELVEMLDCIHGCRG